MQTPSKKPQVEVGFHQPREKEANTIARQYDDDRESHRRLSVDIPGSLHRALKIRCAIEGRDIRDVVMETLGAWVNRPYDDA